VRLIFLLLMNGKLTIGKMMSSRIVFETILLHKHPGSPQIFDGVRVAYFFSFLCFLGFLFCFSSLLCHVHTITCVNS
jgi:hypothetical protein